MSKIRLINFLFLLLLSIPWRGYAQSQIVSGTVKTGKGETLPGVSIIIKGTSQGTTTDLDGKYSIKVEDNKSVLVFSFIGYVTSEVPVGSKTTIDVVLNEDLKDIGEVVVVGYGTAKKSDVTGAVTQVKAKDLSPSVASSVDNLLKGRSAGLQVISSSGQPGQGATIRIRGSNSFAGGSDPLLVVDGLPVGTAGNLKQINPNDIESIDILKDASATAIYGSRGANGVIIVTTKRGKAGQSVIEGSYQYAVSTFPKPLDVIRDPYLVAELANERAANTDARDNTNTVRYVGAINPDNGNYYPSLTEIKNGYPTTNWEKLSKRNGQTQNVSIAGRGGNDNTQYSVSFGYLNQKGMAIGNDYERYTTNLNLDQKVTKRIKVGATVNLAYINQDFPQRAGDILGQMNRNRLFPVTDTTSGKYFQEGPREFNNPVAIRALYRDESKSFDIFASAFADVEIFNGFNFRTNIRTKYGHALDDYYEPIGYGNAGFPQNGEGTFKNMRYTSYVFDNYFTYNKIFGEKHKLGLMAGTSYQEDGQRGNRLIGRGFLNNALTNEDFRGAKTQIIEAFDPGSGEGYTFTTQLMSFMGRLNYNFDERYLVTFTMRADGSSKFGADNKYGYFPSAALAWNVHNENFFPKDNRIINTFKVRAGWGITGNQSALQPYRTLDRFSSALQWFDGGFIPGYGPGVPGVPDQQGRRNWEGIANRGLKWESTNQYNIGGDFGLLNQRLRLTLDYYYKYTSGLLRKAFIAPSTGFSQQWQNDGEVLNQGVELAIDGDVIRSGDFTLSAGFNISHNRSEVKKVEQSIDEVNGVTYITPSFIGAEQEVVRQVPNSLAIGQPMYEFYGYKTDGIVQADELDEYSKLGGILSAADKRAGEIKYVDLDGDGQITTRDRTFIGNPNPLFFYGFNTSATYKNLQLSLFLTGSYGQDVVNLDKLNQGSSQYQRYTVDNPNNEYPSLINGRSLRMSDYFIEKGSFMRIQNISLSYNLNLNTKSIKTLRLNANVENVWTFSKFSGYDPELGIGGNGYGVYTGSGYVRPRVYTVGLNFTF